MDMKRMTSLCLVIITGLMVSGFTLKPFDRVSADHTPPTIVISIPEPTGENGWYNEPVFVRVIAKDGGTGVRAAQLSLGGKIWYNDAMRIALDGEFMVIAQAVDRAGNRSHQTRIIKVDLTPPDALLEVPQAQGENGYYVDIVPISLTGSDALSGVVDTGIQAVGTHAFDGVKSGRETARVTIDASGNYIVEGYVKDQAGNVTNVTASLALDLEAPQVLIETPMQFKGEIPIIGTAQDGFSGIRTLLVDTGSGWSTVDFDGQEWNTVWSAAELADGEYPIRAKVEDHAGNQTMITYDAPILNTLWPFFALFSLLIALAVMIVFDPRKHQLVLLTSQINQHNRMYQHGVMLGLETEDEK